ncbi:HlyD family secretion protein [Parabacteroides distasonis]|uniref:HlyD family secretion protein n=1 Tax=Parabacteroides distasonis TaxID=823 RepID=UPI0018AB3102|nr:HlyD family secretion protein [Parabacteroides distasonis]
MEDSKQKQEIQDTHHVELYNRDITDILGDAPKWLIHTGSYMLYGIIGLLLVGTALFQYTDTVEGTVMIDDLANVKWVMAKSSGPIDEFFVEDGSLVKKNDTIAMIRNQASLKDVVHFCQVLTNVEWFYRTRDKKYLERYPLDLIMGEMTGAYEQFTKAVNDCYQEDEFNVYPRKREFLQKELLILKKYPEKNELEILRVERELFNLSIDRQVLRQGNLKQLELAYERMVNGLRAWEAKYLIKSPASGRIIMGNRWAMTNLVNEGDTICSILSSNKGEWVGRMRLTQQEITGLHVGDPVNIELVKYPAHTYGYLLGSVASISYVPYNKSYALEIHFPNLLRTTARKEIPYEVGLAGNAEIVTSSRSVLSRIFTPISEILHKKE